MRFRIAVAFAALAAAGLAAPSLADDAAASASGGSCPAQQDLSAQRADLITKLQADLAAQQAQGGGADDDVVVLNGRGNNYASDQMPSAIRELRMIEVEMARARAQARAAEGTKP